MRRRRVNAVVITALALAACRPSTSSSSSAGSAVAPTGSASTTTGARSTTTPAPPRVAPPDAAGSATPPSPIDIQAALAQLPELKADPMIAPRTTADGQQLHGTWCLRGSDADGVSHDLAASLASAGWTNIATKGDAMKAGVSAERDGYRASFVVSASTAPACRAPGHYFASLTMFRMRD